MAAGEHYRRKAADINVRATRERNPLIQAEFENLALAYLRLADQADRNARTDVVYEPRPDQPAVPQQQQQQQGEPGKEE
jgi:hypothetical protein